MVLLIRRHNYGNLPLENEPGEFVGVLQRDGTDVPVLRLDRDGQRDGKMMRWGLIPYWAKDEKIGYKMINARVRKVWQGTRPSESRSSAGGA